MTKVTRTQSALQTSLCQFLCLNCVSLRSIGSVQAYEVTPHPCSVGTAEIDSVNHGKGVNHGKDWDYAQINIAPWKLKIFNDQAHERE